MDHSIGVLERLEKMGVLKDCRKAAKQYGVTLEEAFATNDAMKKSRYQPLVWARWTVFRIMQERGWSAKAIAKACGLHHTTVAEGLRKAGGYQEKTREPSEQGGALQQPTGEVDLTMPGSAVQPDSEDEP